MLDLFSKILEVKEKLKRYYSKFEEVYNSDCFPEWFEYIAEHNLKFNESGFNQKEHKLGHFAIFQTPIPPDPKVIMIGKNNSWFVKENPKKSLEYAQKLSEGIPEKDLLSLGLSTYSKNLNNITKEVIKWNPKEYRPLLISERIGMNKIWLQTGPDYSSFNKRIEEIGGKLFEEWSKLKEICHDWTIEIVKDVIEPELVILFGRENDDDCAWTLFEEGTENFTVVKCSHPSGLGTGNKRKKKISRIANQFKQGLLEMLEKNEKI